MTPEYYMLQAIQKALVDCEAKEMEIGIKGVQVEIKLNKDELEFLERILMKWATGGYKNE